MVFEELGEVCEALDGVGAEVMFDAFDIGLLSGGVETEQGEETGKGFVALLHAEGNFPAFVGEDQSAILFVVDVAEFAKLLHHAGDGCLLHLQGRGDIDHPRVTLLLD